ncbi:MAG: hypothetical protein AAF927_08560 [Bacteroidota bacterium]
MSSPYLFVFVLLITLLGACDTSRQASGDDPAEDALIKDHFIVKLAPEVKPEALEASFSKQDLSHQKVIVRSMNLWLFTYDTQKMKPEKMLAKLKASELVLEAQFDKKLSTR